MGRHGYRTTPWGESNYMEATHPLLAALQSACPDVRFDTRHDGRGVAGPNRGRRLALLDDLREVQLETLLDRLANRLMRGAA